MLSRALALFLAAVALAANLADIFVFPDYFGLLIIVPLALGTFAGVGLIVSLRLPRHPIGWLFLAGGTLLALELFTSAFTWASLSRANPLPFTELVLWVNSWMWNPAMASVIVAAGFLFPTGRPATRAQGLILAFFTAVVVVKMVATAFGSAPIQLPTPLSEPSATSVTRANPMALPGPLGDALHVVDDATYAVLPVMLLLTVASVVARLRASVGIERLQMKWFASAAALSFVLLAAAFGGVALETAGIFQDPTPAIGGLSVVDLLWVLGVVALSLIPVSAGIAILRYRLYEIDVLINRTIVYLALTTSLAAVYVASVLGIQRVISPVTAGSEIAVAASTLLVVALFQPLRRRIRSAVDRRFYRSRYDAERTLDAFNSRLRDVVDLDDVRRELLSAVDTTVQPRQAGVWLRGAERT